MCECVSVCLSSHSKCSVTFCVVLCVENELEWKEAQIDLEQSKWNEAAGYSFLQFYHLANIFFASITCFGLSGFHNILSKHDKIVGFNVETLNGECWTSQANYDYLFD